MWVCRAGWGQRMGPCHGPFGEKIAQITEWGTEVQWLAQVLPLVTGGVRTEPRQCGSVGASHSAVQPLDEAGTRSRSQAFCPIVELAAAQRELPAPMTPSSSTQRPVAAVTGRVVIRRRIMAVADV